MARIDTTKIEGYDKMTPEQKLSALEGYDYEDNTDELERTKTALSKANSEAAENKRKLKEKMTEEEQKAQADAEDKQKLQKERDDLLERVSVSENTAQLISLGYDPALAAETAKAMFDGDTTKVFANQKKHQENIQKKIEADLLNKTPTPPAGGGKLTAEAFQKMTLTDKAKLKLSDPDLFKTLSAAPPVPPAETK